MSVCVFGVGGGWGAGGVKPAGPMKSNPTTLFRQHIPLLFALEESDAWRGGRSGEGEGW